MFLKFVSASLTPHPVGRRVWPEVKYALLEGRDDPSVEDPTASEEVC